MKKITPLVFVFTISIASASTVMGAQVQTMSSTQKCSSTMSFDLACVREKIQNSLKKSCDVMGGKLQNIRFGTETCFQQKINSGNWNFICEQTAKSECQLDSLALPNAVLALSFSGREGGIEATLNDVKGEPDFATNITSAGRDYLKTKLNEQSEIACANDILKSLTDLNKSEAIKVTLNEIAALTKEEKLSVGIRVASTDFGGFGYRDYKKTPDLRLLNRDMSKRLDFFDNGNIIARNKVSDNKIDQLCIVSEDWVLKSLTAYKKKLLSQKNDTTKKSLEFGDDINATPAVSAQ